MTKILCCQKKILKISLIRLRISKRLRDTELNQREILKLIESLSSKVDNLSSVNSEQGYLTTRTENSGNPTEELEEVDLISNVRSNNVRAQKVTFMETRH